MDFEKGSNLIDIKIKGKLKSFFLLKDIQEICSNFIKEIKVDHKKKILKDFNEIISNIETKSELNYYFLKYLKEKNITIKEYKKDLNYITYLNKLKETLTNEHLKLLEEEERENPSGAIIDILKEYVTNKENNIENGYKNIVNKYPISFIKLNFPLVTGIERLRQKYYRDLLIEKDIANNFS